MDLETTTTASAHIDVLIERRATQRENANEREAMWKEGVRRHRERIRQENRTRWYAYHLDQAERLRRTMTALVERHEVAAAALLEDQPKGAS